MKKSFEFEGASWEAYSNEKEYGAKKTVYVEVSRNGGKARKVSFSKASKTADFAAGDAGVAWKALDVLGIAKKVVE